MAGAVLMFRSTIGSDALKLFADIEREHGREVMGVHYNKIARLVQTCSEASKVVGIAASELVDTSLGALHFALRNEIVKPAEVTLSFIDGRDPGKDKKQADMKGFVLKVVARHAFLQHIELERLDLAEKAGGQAATIVEDLSTLLSAVKTYALFERAFTSPEGTSPQDFLEIYKERTMNTKLGRDAADLVYDVLGGEHDDRLAEMIKPAGEGWAKLVDWRRVDISGWTEMARQLSLHGPVSIEASAPPRGAAPRALARSLSTASDDAVEEHKNKESERERVWQQATATRRKWVNFHAPRAWKEKELDAAFEASSAHTWDGGRATEKHRVFIFSADLIHESEGPAWARTPEWHAALSEECCKFMQSKRGPADLLVFCDGRSRSCRNALEKLTQDARNQIELWATYQASSRLGRRVAWGSDNKEVIIMSFPVPRTQMPVKPRKSNSDGVGAGESTTHDATYSGVTPMSWAGMTLVTDGDKQKILGATAGKETSKPRTRVFDTAFGQPLFWAERKTITCWENLLQDLNASMVVDCSPGSGTAARAALQLNINYFGLARNVHHANLLNNVADRQAVMMMRTAGNPLHHQDMAECISAHYSQLIASLETMANAKDTCPDGEINIEEVAPA